MSASDRLHELEAEARYHREKLQLYRARMYSVRPVSRERLRELERLDHYADLRLRKARQDSDAGHLPPDTP